MVAAALAAAAALTASCSCLAQSSISAGQFGHPTHWFTLQFASSQWHQLAQALQPSLQDLHLTRDEQESLGPDGLRRPLPHAASKRSNDTLIGLVGGRARLGCRCYLRSLAADAENDPLAVLQEESRLGGAPPPARGYDRTYEPRAPFSMCGCARRSRPRAQHVQAQRGHGSDDVRGWAQVVLERAEHLERGRERLGERGEERAERGGRQKRRVL